MTTNKTIIIVLSEKNEVALLFLEEKVLTRTEKNDVQSKIRKMFGRKKKNTELSCRTGKRLSFWVNTDDVLIYKHASNQNNER